MVVSGSRKTVVNHAAALLGIPKESIFMAVGIIISLSPKLENRVAIVINTVFFFTVPPVFT